MIRLTCQKCGKKGISLFEKLLVRKSRNISCKECAAEYNYSWWVGVLINVLAAAFGTLLFYLVFFVNLIYAVILWFAIALLFAGLTMMLLPLRETKIRD